MTFLVMWENDFMRKLRLFSKFMMLEGGRQIITIPQKVTLIRQ